MRQSRLSHYKQDRLIEHFVAGTTARTAASLCRVNRKTAAFFLRFPSLEREAKSEGMFGGEIKVCLICPGNQGRYTGKSMCAEPAGKENLFFQ